MPKIRRRLLIGLGVLGALLVLAIIGISFEMIRGRWALTTYKRELRAKGEKLTLEELGLPKIPKEENGAKALFEAADKLAALKESCPLINNGIPSMKLIAPGRAQVSATQMEIKSGARASSSWADLSQEIMKANHVLEPMKEALKKPALALDFDYTKGFSQTNGFFLNLSKTRAVARALSPVALNNLHQGNLDGAVENIRAIANLSRLLKNEPPIISQLVRIAVNSIGLGITWEALQAPGWKDTQLSELQSAWSFRGFTGDMLKSFEVERSMGAKEYDMHRHSREKWRGDIEFMSQMQAPDNYKPWGLDSDWVMNLHFFLWSVVWSQQDELHSLRLWSRDIEEARKVVQSRSWSSAKSLLNQENEHNEPKFYDRCRFPLSIHRVSMSRAVLSAVRCETQHELTVVAIALKRYQLRHGKPPSDLTSLVPEFLPQLPHDWMDGKPLRYHPNADGSFVLYSVGEDGIDDGGNPNPLTGKSFSSIWNGRDMVWSMPATKKEIAAAEAMK